MGPLLHRLKIVAPDPAQIEYQTRHARLVAFRAAATHLERMQRDGLISAHAWELVRPELVERAGDLGVKVRELLQGNPAMADAELADARRELGRAQRSALLGLRRDGVISDEVYATLIAEVDSGLSDHTEELDESGVEG
jgi:CPA1 family monovalent cation:H+ antiporter